MSHKPRKRFGQNFLRDKQVIQQIITAIAPQASQTIIEIGPGEGALTQQLLPLVKQLIVIEIDRDLIPKLKQRFATDKLIIHQADALTFDFNQLAKANEPLRIVGNLPYNISTPLLFHLLTTTTPIKNMHFMLQKEVVDRLSAQPGQSAYGRLSIMTQYYCQVTPLFTVSPQAFYPQPKVESAIVRLRPYEKLPFIVENFQLFSDIVKQAFSQRRKTLQNSLKKFINSKQLETLGITPSLRPENISLAEYVEISNLVHKSSII